MVGAALASAALLTFGTAPLPAAASVTAAQGSPPPGAAVAPSPAGVETTIRSANNTGMCLYMPSFGSGAGARLSACGSHNYYWWSYDGRLRSAGSNKCLTSGGKFADPLVQLTCIATTGGAQGFRLARVAPATAHPGFSWVSFETWGKNCIGISGGGAPEGGVIAEFTCAYTGNQRWLMQTAAIF